MTVSILGCGWFGIPLAKSLISKDHQVKGSTTSEEKLATLASHNIIPFLINVGAKDNIFDDSFFQCDVFIIAITPRLNDSVSYHSKIEIIASLLQQHKTKKVILISSTGVYDDCNAHVNEQTIPNPEKQSGKIIWQAESLLKNSSHFTSTAIRFGGLVGPGRHPGRFLAGKTDLSNGKAPVNMIHLSDCIGICNNIIENDFNIDTLNAVCPHHPTREEFYTVASTQLGVTAPTFNAENTNWKIVDSVYLENLLHYKFIVSDWNEWLKDSD
ncbi:MAG TPA: NAD(P)H-binding protein [Cyclobacteriaceae bacterium]|nr:NAD(P)H-binding protein [Cyclobacteriaceae bacterium]